MLSPPIYMRMYIYFYWQILERKLNKSLNKDSNQNKSLDSPLSRRLKRRLNSISKGKIYFQLGATNPSWKITENIRREQNKKKEGKIVKYNKFWSLLWLEFNTLARRVKEHLPRGPNTKTETAKNVLLILRPPGRRGHPL